MKLKKGLVVLSLALIGSSVPVYASTATDVTANVAADSVDKHTITDADKHTITDADKHTATDATTQATTQATAVKKAVTKKGVGTFSADGKFLTDESGVKYRVAEKVKKADLKAGLKIADKATKGKYKVTKITKKKNKIVSGVVTYTGAYNTNSTQVTVKDTIKVAGVKFKVTSVNQKAFKGNKKLTKVTIGANVTKIGANAFNGCAKLKRVTVKSTKLTNIGANAFKGINKKAKFKVPAKKLTTYTKLIKKAKAPKTAKITK